jgi:hypothetical protein
MAVIKRPGPEIGSSMAKIKPNAYGENYGIMAQTPQAV